MRSTLAAASAALTCITLVLPAIPLRGQPDRSGPPEPSALSGRSGPSGPSAPSVRTPPAESPRGITEAEYLAGVVADPEAHPATRALTGPLGAARADLVKAETLADPVLSAMREEPSGGPEQIDLTVAWQPPRPDRRRLATDAAGARVEAAGARLAADRLALRSAVRETFASWALAAARRTVLEHRAERIDALAAREELRAERGESSGLAARRLRLEADRARAEAVRSRAALARASAAARAFRPDLPPDAEPILPPPPAMETGETGPPHPRISALEADVRATRLEADLAERVLSFPELVAGWQTIDAPDGGSPSTDGPLVGFSWTLPVLDRNRAEKARAAARATSDAARLEMARREVAAERAGAEAAYRELRTAALEMQHSADAAGPVVEQVDATFRLGEADLTDLLETLRSATETELAALDLLGEALAAHRALERAAGRPLAPEIDTESDDFTTTTSNGDSR